MIDRVADRPEEERPAVDARRSFLQAALTVGPAAALMATCARTARAQEPANPPKIQIPQIYPGWNAKNFAEIRTNENTHFQFLTTALGSNALPLPQLNIQNLTLNPQSPIYFAAYAQIFENTDAGAYLATGPLLSDRGLLAQAASILVVEANQAGYLNSLINYPIVNNGVAFAQPFPIPVILNNVSPFIVNPAPLVQLANSISSTPSAANDLAILNFARMLEFVGAVFYNINVPIFFNV